MLVCVIKAANTSLQCRMRMPERRQRWISASLTAGVLGGLIALALTKIDWRELPRALSDVNVGWLAVALGLTAASNLARAESWFAVIRAALPHHVISRAAVARGLLIGAATSSVTPARLGEPVRAWLIARRLGGVRALATVAGTVFAQTLLNLLALMILAILVLAASTIPGARTAAIATAAVLPVLILAALLAGPRVALAARPVRSQRLRRLSTWVGRQLVAVRGGLVAFRRPRTAAHAAAPQLSAWAMQFGCCYAVLLALGLQHRATLLAAAAVLLAVNLTAILPLTPSNVGVYQAACIAVLAPFGVNAAQALAYGLVLQAVEVVSGLALGLPALAREGLSLTELRREASAASPRAAG